LKVAARARAATFNAASVAVLRVGVGGTALVNGTAAAVFVDEYSPSTGTLVQSVALSTSLCTLTVGWSTYSWWDAEGLPSLSGDGTLITVGCYKVRCAAGRREGGRHTTPCWIARARRRPAAGLMVPARIACAGG
jgi:hypothetical protein